MKGGMETMPNLAVPLSRIFYFCFCGAQQKHLHEQECGWALGWLGSIMEQEAKWV